MNNNINSLPQIKVVIKCSHPRFAGGNLTHAPFLLPSATIYLRNYYFFPVGTVEAYFEFGYFRFLFNLIKLTWNYGF